jgi:hypothetical protein
MKVSSKVRGGSKCLYGDIGISCKREEFWEFLLNQSSFAVLRPIRLAYQPPASSTFLSEQTNHQQPANSTFHPEQISTNHQPPAKRTGCWNFVASVLFNDSVVVD